MASDRGRGESRAFYVDFRRSRLYLGGRFWVAIGLAFVSILASVNADTSTPFGKGVLAVVALVGVVIGVLVQPSPKPIDHETRARQAIQNLSTSNQLIDDVKTVAEQLDAQANQVRTKIGLANMTQDLSRAQGHITLCMAAWDQVAPGAVEQFKIEQRRGYQILAQLAEGTESD